MIVVCDTSPICYLLLSLKIIGLVGILKDAAKSGLLDLKSSFERLREVGFWVAPSLLEQLLKKE